jgi:polysaccharide biosynthesis protein PslG
MSRRVSFVAAVMLALSTWGPVAAQENPFQTASPEYGASVFLWGFAPTTQRDLAKLNDAGLTWQKTLFQWRYIEPQRGRYDWAEAERIVKASNARGIDVIARLDLQPAWSRADATLANSPPDDMQDWGNFVYAFVDHFRAGSPNGTVRAVQLWNEPNLSREWGGLPMGPDSAAQYTSMLCSGYTAAKLADPNVIVLTAGLSPNGFTDEAARDETLYLREIYASGGGACFDAVGGQGNAQAPEPEMPIGSWQGCDFGATICEHGSFYFRRIEELHQVMVDNEDSRQIWLLEFGWTSDPVNPDYSWHAVSEEQKADNIVRAYRYAYENWSPWIGPMILWTIAAPDWNDTQEQYWWAVTYPNGDNRPAYDALAAARASGYLP